MSRPCTICIHPALGRINQLLRDGRSARSVAIECAVGERAMHRHATSHLDRTQAVESVGNPDREADPLTELVASLRPRALAGDPLATREYRLALMAEKSARGAVPAVDLAQSAEWVELRTVLLRALEPFPEARWAVSDAIGERYR